MPAAAGPARSRTSTGCAAPPTRWRSGSAWPARTPPPPCRCPAVPPAPPGSGVGCRPASGALRARRGESGPRAAPPFYPPRARPPAPPRHRARPRTLRAERASGWNLAHAPGRACSPPGVTHPPRVRRSTPAAGPAPAWPTRPGAGWRQSARGAGRASGERGASIRPRDPAPLRTGGREAWRSPGSPWLSPPGVWGSAGPPPSAPRSGPELESVTNHCLPACLLPFSPAHRTLRLHSSP